MFRIQEAWQSFASFAVFLTFVIGCKVYQRRIRSNGGKKKMTSPPITETDLPSWAKDLDIPNISRKKLESLNKRKPHHIWNTVIFFPDLLPTRYDAPLKQVVHLFKQAKTSIYLCMYLCSHWRFNHIILGKYKEGLNICLISDNDTWTAHNSFGFHALVKGGIPTKLNMNGYLMHNKFAIIDEEAVITGSLNWTYQGVQSNNENVMVTTDPRITSSYLQEFNRLYFLCKDIDKDDVPKTRGIGTGRWQG